MLITKLEDLSQYYAVISEDLAKIPDFLQENKNPAVGKYDLGDESYVNVLQYDTKENDGKYEAHRQYLDVQIMLEGEEFAYMQKLAKGIPQSEYDEQKDVQFFSAEEATRIVLREGITVIFFSEDLHRPSIKIEETKRVKKAVFKIKIKTQGGNNNETV